MHGQRGQGTVEYLGAVLLVAGVIAVGIALLGSAGVGGRVMDAFRRALCVVTGARCDGAPARPCVVRSRRRSEGGRLSVLLVGSADHDALLREERSDGTVALTVVHGGAAGLDLSSGVGAHARWGAWSGAVGGELRAAVLAGAESGRTWIAGSAAEAARMLERIRLAGLPAALRRGVAIPEPSETFAERTGDLTLELRRGAGRALALSSEEAYGERIDRTTGRRTVYVRTGRAARARLAFGRGAGGGGAEADERFGITYDPAGRPVDFMVLAAAQVDGAAALPPPLARLAGRLRIPLRGARHVETEQHLDLTDPDNGRLVEDFLARAGDGQVGLVLAAHALRRRLEAHGTLAVRAYASEQVVHAVGGQVRLGPVGVGGEISRERTSATLVSAVAQRADGTWGADPDCLAA